MKFYSTYDIERHCSGHFFSRDAKRFFSSRISELVYQGPGGIYFITSEQYSNERRKFTVRQYNEEERSVETVGDFNVHTRSVAHRIARDLSVGAK